LINLEASNVIAQRGRLGKSSLTSGRWQPKHHSGGIDRRITDNRVIPIQYRVHGATVTEQHVHIRQIAVNQPQRAHGSHFGGMIRSRDPLPFGLRPLMGFAR